MSASFKIIDYNYASKSNVTISASSENSNFVASNVGKEFRSQVWRSSGYYVVTSSNNKINFKETAMGAELTATITPDEYVLSDLLVEIKSQMESASVNARTYTISRNSVSGRFTISGSVYLDLLFSTGSDAGTSLRNVLGFGSNDYTGATSYTGPQASWHTEEGVVIDLQSAEEIDTVAVLFDPQIGIKLSDSALIYVQASATNSWSSPGFSQQVYIDNTWSVITLFLDTPEEYRFWRIKVVDPQNAYGYIELGTVVLGLDIDLGRCADNGFSINWDDGSRVQTNEFGNSYADVFPTVKELTFNFNILTLDQQKLLESMYRRVGSREPVFVALDTSETLFDKDHFWVYGRLPSNLDFKHLVRSYFSSDFKIRESL